MNSDLDAIERALDSHDRRGDLNTNVGRLCGDLLGEVKRLRDGIRSEHRPVANEGWAGEAPLCAVCTDPNDEMLMEWPCPTARLLDDADETAV